MTNLSLGFQLLPDATVFEWLRDEARHILRAADSSGLVDESVVTTTVTTMLCLHEDGLSPDDIRQQLINQLSCNTCQTESSYATQR